MTYKQILAILARCANLFTNRTLWSPTNYSVMLIQGL